jgi:hypothetical protein
MNRDFGEHKDFGIMIKKQGNFIESHIEKAVLLIGVLGAIFIVYKFVLGSGEEIPFNGQKFHPGQLDIYIAEQSDKLQSRLEREPILKPAYIPQSEAFLAKMSSVLDKDLNVFWPVPSSVEITVDKRYRIPVMGDVNDVLVGYIRAAAYLPKVAITPENVESEDSYEPNDLDLVTVQGSFDLGPLIDSFQECFTGKGVPEGWRDKGLAKPVFAGVQLQRQRLDENGDWSQWEDIPRLRIDPKRDIYKIIDDVNNLPMGGVMVQIAQLGDQRTQASMLQPGPYRIASAEDNWLPPVLHEKFLTVRRDKEAQDRREAATERETKTAEEREKMTTTRSTREERGTGVPGGGGRSTTTVQPMSGAGGRGAGGGAATRSAGGGTATRSTGGGAASSRGAGGGRPTAAEPDRSGGTRNTLRSTSRTDTRTETTTTEQKKNVKTTITEATINEELKKMRLMGKDISSLHETITFWAHDDTVEPGASYRYRIRIGVFNPVAGTGQVQAEDAASNSKVILWSDFSEETDIVDIPKRLYFFPINVQEAAKQVEFQVCKYVMGYWYSSQFMVKQGDVIGKTSKVEASDKNKTTDLKDVRDVRNVKEAKLPETIDYTTGAIVVAVVPMNDWFGDKTLQPRQYFDVLYSFDGTRVERLPAKLMNWPEDLRLKYSELKSLEKKTKEPLRDWTSSGTEMIQINAPTPGGVDRRGRGMPQEPGIGTIGY